jgi:glucosyl-dolichyl phosphate glucuronosyltransferase
MTGTIDDISVIICAYTEERWSDLVAAVESVQKQILPPREIIVVIDHNPNLMERTLRQVPGVIVVENMEALGLSGARNSGIAVAKSQIIAFLDDDTVARLDWLTLLSEEFTNPWVLGIGGAVTPLWLDEDPAWLPEEFYWVVGCTYLGMPKAVQTIRNPVGANMAFRREVFEAVGGFRNGIGRVGTLPVGCEETELCIRASQHWPQGVFLYQPKARVYHRVPGNRTSWRYFCERCFAEGRSKAVITSYVGAKDSLSSELTYTFRTLSKGIVHYMVNGVFRLDVCGFLRAATIISGFMITMVGYLIGGVFLRVARLRKHSEKEGVFPSNDEMIQLSKLNHRV